MKKVGKIPPFFIILLKILIPRERQSYLKKRIGDCPLSYILAIQMAGVSRGRNGFQKQKAGEKLAETEEDLLEHRTDESDAYDTLYIVCEKFPQHDVFAFDAGGVM